MDECKHGTPINTVCWACTHPDKEEESAVASNDGLCPHCGHTVPGTIVETYEYQKRQPNKKKATLGERWRYFKAMFMMW